VRTLVEILGAFLYAIFVTPWVKLAAWLKRPY
jgi:hypothetical protein